MKKIIITGWAGFIGSNFLNTLVPRHPEIQFLNLDLLTYAGDLTKIDDSVRNSANYAFFQIDIRDKEALHDLYERAKPTDIIHFAAESHVDNSIKNPRIFTETNVIGTQNLLDLHREFGLWRFHYISTDEVYGDIPEWGFFTESTPLHPSSPYSASKAAGDMLTSAYGRTFGIDYTITRCSNNYGPHQDHEKLIPHFIDLLKNDQPVPLYGDGSNIRDWLYVVDHCEAVWEVFTRAQRGSVYNIGWNNEYTNLEITKILIAKMGKSESLIEFVADRPWHDKRYAIDATKIQRALGWEPKVDFRDGIEKTIAFYLNEETH